MKVIAILTVLLLTACANHGKLREQELIRLADWLPGHYESADSDLLIMPIAAPFIGERVLYVERTDSSNQVLAQSLFRFEKSADEKTVLQRTFALKEPQRWQRGHQRPEIFVSLLGADVTATPACDLIWTFGEEVLTAKAVLKACRLQGMRFDGDELTFTERDSNAATLAFQRVTVD